MGGPYTLSTTPNYTDVPIELHDAIDNTSNGGCDIMSMNLLLQSVSHRRETGSIMTKLARLVVRDVLRGSVHSRENTKRYFDPDDGASVTDFIVPKTGIMKRAIGITNDELKSTAHEVSALLSGTLDVDDGKSDVKIFAYNTK
jgi:hypothetical protein